MTRPTPTLSNDKLAKFRDPPAGETDVEQESPLDFKSDDATSALSPEREKEIREQTTGGPYPRICAARTRRGTLCECKKLYKNGRCKFHGGLSTGPKTPEGKAKAALNLEKARWMAARIRAWRAEDKRREEAGLENAPSGGEGRGRGG
jgi:hypothetical protein